VEILSSVAPCDVRDVTFDGGVMTRVPATCAGVTWDQPSVGRRIRKIYRKLFGKTFIPICSRAITERANLSLSRFPTFRQDLVLQIYDDGCCFVRLPVPIGRFPINRPRYWNVGPGGKIGPLIQRQSSTRNLCLHLSVVRHPKWMSERELHSDDAR